MDDLYTFTSNPDFFHMTRFTGVADTCTADVVHLQVQLDDQTAEIDRHATGGINTSDDLIKTQIASHPRYPDLVSAYIECQKVGAPPELASLLEETGRVNHQITTLACTEIGADPELDEFMESYCGVLERYKEELSKPFDEATTFLSNMESELNNLCNGSPTAITRTAVHNNDHSDEAVMSCVEGEMMGTEGQEYSSNDNSEPEREREQEHDMRGMLMRKYGGYLGSLRKEFLSKRKKGKLPKDAISGLLDWWNLHHRWPYPTEEDKSKLSEMTGLDQKQISNWFINHRKRHWKPSEDMKAALLEGLAPDRSSDSDLNGPTHTFLD